MCGGQGEQIQFRRRSPDTVVSGGRSSTTPHYNFFGSRGARPSERNTPCLQRDAIARNRMFYSAKRLKGWRAHAETFCCADNFQIRLLNRSSRRQSALTFLSGIMSGFIPLCGTAAWAWINFRVRKFPEMRIHDPGGPLANKETSVSLNHKGNEMSRGDRGALAEVGQFFGAVFAKGNAKLFHRANRALWLPRRAN